MKIVEYPENPECGYYLIEINGNIEKAYSAYSDTPYATYIDGLYLMREKDIPLWESWYEEEEGRCNNESY